MANAQWFLEVALLLLLAATLFHALRLERALGVLKRDRAVLEELVQGFNDSTRQAESGIERLRSAADGAGRQISRQVEAAQLLRDDLTFLTDRSDRLAERLEAAVRSARMLADTTACTPHAPFVQTPAVQAPIVQAPIVQAPAVQAPAEFGSPTTSTVLEPPPRQTILVQGHQPRVLSAEDDAAPPSRLRSQAERDLLRALRAGQ